MTNVNSKLKIHLPSLIPFGFILADNRYIYREVFMEGQFEAVVEVDEAGQLSSYVWDCEMEEVYTAHLVTAPAGAFVGQVRESYQVILARVGEACCVALPFSKDKNFRLMHQDEAGFGRFSKLSTCWSLKVHRPSIASHRIREYRNCYGAVDTNTGDSFFIKADVCNCDCVSELPSHIPSLTQMSISF